MSETGSKQSRQATEIWVTAAWWALAFGLVEGPLLLLLSYTAPRTSQLALVGVNQHILWVAPAFDLLLFGVLALTLLGAEPVLRRLGLQRVPLAVFSFLSFLGLLLLPSRLSKPAAGILALGLTAVLYRFVAARAPAAQSWFRRTLPLLAAVCVLVTVAVHLREPLAERLLTKASADGAQRPNVLLIVLDTVRADRLSVYGYPRPTTPALEALAAEGTRFSNAYATSSWTIPSHASLFTGQYPFQHGAGKDRLGDDPQTLAEVFRDHGYRTAGFVANMETCSRGSGLARGFLHYEDFFTTWPDFFTRTVYGRRIFRRLPAYLGYYNAPGRKQAEEVNANFLGWLDGQRGDRHPFFVFLNYFDAHDPYMPPQEFAARFSPQPQALTARRPLNLSDYLSGGTTEELRRMESDAYDASLAYMDAQLGLLFGELRRRGVLDQTVVVVTSDHGELLFEHGLMGHSLTLYQKELHIPLMVRFPEKVLAGGEDTGIVNLASLGGMVLHLAGIETQFPGARPNEKLLSAPHAEPHATLAELETDLWAVNPGGWPPGVMRSLLDNRWHYILHSSGAVELYDLQNDPDETRNLGALAEQTILEDYRRKLETLLNGNPQPAKAAAHATSR